MDVRRDQFGSGIQFRFRRYVSSPPLSFLARKCGYQSQRKGRDGGGVALPSQSVLLQ